MPPRKAAPQRWHRQEIEVLVHCLKDDDFMAEHAPSHPRQAFPVFSIRESSAKGSEAHKLCSAISTVILERAGSHNANNLRPFASIATKILAAREQAPPGASPEDALATFDLDKFAGPAEDSVAAAAASSTLEPPDAYAEDDDAGVVVAPSSEAAGMEDDGDGVAVAAAAAADDMELPEEPPVGVDDGADGAADAGDANHNGGGDAHHESGHQPIEEDEYDDTYHAPVITKSGGVRTISFQTRILNQHLVCTLCMGYFNDACTIIECLHTFCRRCIMTHFKESRECPQCEKRLGTNPRDLVRTDRTLQSIVDKVFPQYSAKPPGPSSSSAGGGGSGLPEAAAAAAAAGGDGSSGADNDGEAARADDGGGGRDSAEQPPRKVARVSPAAAEAEVEDNHAMAADGDEEVNGGGGAAADDDVPGGAGAGDDNGGEDDAGADEGGAAAEDQGRGGGAAADEDADEDEDTEISFSLHELPRVDGSAPAYTGLEKPYLRTKAMLTVGHLQKYLGRKMGLKDATIEFVCRGDPLSETLTLQDIVRTVWMDEVNDLVLHYRVG